MGDLRGWAATASAGNPVDPAARAAFAKRKVLTALTRPAAASNDRMLAAQNIARTLSVALQDVIQQPVPGGVGFGFFYTEDFRRSWGTGTSLRFDIVCPERPGGNVSDWLYLTSTNRSTVGVEALVSYHAQDEPQFFIYEWAVPGFVVSVPLASLAPYLAAGKGERSSSRNLSVWNSTYNIGGFYWRNAVYLHNRVRQGWDLIYQNDYASDDATQKSGGGWGPIVETFQPAYSGTQPMGFKRTAFSEADSSGRWSQWALLKPDQSTVRQDNNGFDVRDMNPNFGFTAVS
jgi:hypothetical protein